MFSFPPQLESDRQTENWYQDLLDHPECQGNPAKIQEAYESYRQAGLTRSLASLGGGGENPSKPKIVPNQALVQYLARVNSLATDSSPATEDIESPYQNEDVNCMVLWARPSSKVLNLLLDLQNRLKAVVGTDMWFPEESRLHLSVLEISHRHSMAHLRSVADKMGAQLLQKILDYPTVLSSRENPTDVRLGKPMLIFDSAGVAVGFVPVETDPYTYHNLRTDLFGMALEGDVKMDTCYTACTAHITLGRFVSTETFQRGGEEVSQAQVEAWVNTILSINKELQELYWTAEWNWIVGGQKGLELQMGMLKFGRGIETAELVGRSTSR